MDYFSINPMAGIGSIAAQKPLKRENVDIEFAKIFYKEVLRQVFTLPENGGENVFASSVNQDIFIDKLAEEMARKNMSLINVK
jgi:hypothetical protein